MAEEEFKKHETRSGPPVWMLSLADLISLLLTFFVMLFAMSKVKIDRWDEVVDSLSQSIKPSPREENDEPMASLNIPRVYRKPAMNLDYLSAVIDDAIDDNPVLVCQWQFGNDPKGTAGTFCAGRCFAKYRQPCRCAGAHGSQTAQRTRRLCLKLGTFAGPCCGCCERIEKIRLHRLHKYLRICCIKIRPAS